MPNEMDFKRKIPVRHDVDVVVAGGGPSGIAAAITAARQGKSVFLAERHTCFGGMGTAGRVPMFCKFSDGINFLAGGIGREVYDLCWEYGAVGPDDKADTDKKFNSNSIRTEVLKRIYDDMMYNSGIYFSFITNLIGVEKEGDALSHIICSSKSGLFGVKAKVFIDCTGDGDLAHMAGAPWEKGDESGKMQPATLCSLWYGIDWPAVKNAGYHDLWPRNDKKVHQAYIDGVLSYDDGFGMVIEGQQSGGGNIGHIFGVDGTDESSYTKGIIQGRKSMLEYERYYKQYLTGFDKLELAATGELLGIRETRRIQGDYVLNLDDFKRRAIFEDEIGRYNYEVDLHHSDSDEALKKQSLEMMQKLRCDIGESYGIPYRALIPQNLSNVLVAGRCISADRYIHGSIRVMPGCFITGQAAGMAAFLACEGNGKTRDISVKELQKSLKAMGAFLPNCL